MLYLSVVLFFLHIPPKYDQLFQQRKPQVGLRYHRKVRESNKRRKEQCKLSQEQWCCFCRINYEAFVEVGGRRNPPFGGIVMEQTVLCMCMRVTISKYAPLVSKRRCRRCDSDLINTRHAGNPIRDYLISRMRFHSATAIPICCAISFRCRRRVQIKIT